MKPNRERSLPDSDFNIWKVPFTRENALRAKMLRRKHLTSLPIDEKIKIVESLRKRASVLRKSRVKVE